MTSRNNLVGLVNSVINLPLPMFYVLRAQSLSCLLLHQTPHAPLLWCRPPSLPSFPPKPQNQEEREWNPRTSPSSGSCCQTMLLDGNHCYWKAYHRHLPPCGLFTFANKPPLSPPFLLPSPSSLYLPHSPSSSPLSLSLSQCWYASEWHGMDLHHTESVADRYKPGTNLADLGSYT